MSQRTLIAIDGTPISSRTTGAGRFLLNLIRTLPTVDPVSEYVVFLTDAGLETVTETPAKMECVRVPMASGFLWELFGLSSGARRRRATAVLTTREILGRSFPPTVLHLFEPPEYRIARRHGERPWKHRQKDRLLRMLLRRSLRLASAVTAGSGNTRDWVEARFGVKADVIHPGIDPIFLRPPSRVRRARHFLHLSGGDQRDNTDMVLEAMRGDPKGPRLLLAGATRGHRTRLKKRLSDMKLNGRVHVLDWVPDEMLVSLYQEAIALIHPSLYEGFVGYPVLEAAACGTPSIVLSSPGLEDLPEHAAVKIARNDPGSLTQSMKMLATNVQRRDSIGSAARNWAGQFTWERAAGSFARVLRQVAASGDRFRR